MDVARQASPVVLSVMSPSSIFVAKDDAFAGEQIEDSNINTISIYSETTFEVNWQISLLGLEAGSERLRGFIELGTGEQGIGLIGLRYKF